MKKRRLTGIFAVMAMLQCSCSQQADIGKQSVPDAESVNNQTQESSGIAAGSDKSSEIIEGNYTAQAVMSDGKLVAFKDNAQLADLYDTNWVTVYNDGTFGIQNGIYWSTGKWERIEIEDFDNAFLFAQTERARGSQSSHSDTTESRRTYIGYLSNGDINTLILLDKDYKEGDTALVYVRDGTESAYLSDSTETAASSQSQPSSGSQNTHSSTDTSSPSTSRGQKNAVAKAKEYLEFIAFSHDGLVEQLEFEGFSHSEAVYGADHCGADWYEQAERKAREYLDTMSFSYSGLYDQLIFEGFTDAEAQYGVDAAY